MPRKRKKKEPRFGIFFKDRWISSEELLKEFETGLTLEKLGKKYAKSSTEILYRISQSKEKYRKALQTSKQNRKSKTEEERIKFYVEYVRKKGYIPPYDEFYKETKMHLYNYLHSLCKAAAIKEGFDFYTEEKRKEKEKRHSLKKKLLLANLKKIAKQLGRSPKFKELNVHGKFKAHSYGVYFESFSKALEIAGLPPSRPSNNAEKPISKGKQKILNDLAALTEKLGRKPMRREVVKHGQFPYSKYKIALGRRIADYIQFGEPTT